MTAANALTAARAVGVVACAAIIVVHLAASGPATPGDGWSLALVSGPVRLLDALDGYLARRFDAVTPGGYRFDTEVDAAMVAVLSVAALTLTPWPILVGSAHYLFLLGRRIRPAWRRPLPARASTTAMGATIAGLMWASTAPRTEVARVSS